MTSKPLRGLITIDKSSVKSFKIMSKLFDNKHFVIIVYDALNVNMSMVKYVFNKLNGKHRLGDTWFMEMPDRKIASVSFKIFSWMKYRAMLFEPGIDQEFKRNCLDNKYASLDVDPNHGMKYLFDSGAYMKNNNWNASMDADNLKKSFCMLVFGKLDIAECGASDDN